MYKMSNLKSDLSLSESHTRLIGQSVGDLSALPGVGGAEGDNTPVQEACCTSYDKGKAILSDYLESVSQNSEYIRTIGIQLDSMDKAAARIMRRSF